MRGLILAAGDATRFSKNGFCKSLLRINGKHLIEYALDILVSLSVSEICIVAGRYEKALRGAVGYAYGEIPVRYVRQPVPEGLMNALYCAADFIGSHPFTLLLGDEIFLSPDLFFAEKISEADFLCGYTLPKDPAEICENYALECSGDTLLHTEEKPLVSYGGKKGTGLCVFRGQCLTELFSEYADQHAHWNLCDVMNELLRRGKKGIAVRVAEEEINVNDPEKYAYAKLRLEPTNE